MGTLITDNNDDNECATATNAASTPETATETQTQLDWKSFLERTPPEAVVTVNTALILMTGGKYSTEKTGIQRYCTGPECESLMWFDHIEGAAYAARDDWGSAILKYRCRNCQTDTKTFAIYMKPLASTIVSAVKIGEYPSFGPPTPPRVISLIGPDRELFLKGRRAENRGLGIGAFAYYRRVVENQKNRIIEEIIKVAQKVGARTELIEGLRTALKETQFSSAIESVKPAIPESLLIDGRNPLKLLHTALSRGLHEQDDSRCLELAQSIRVVLTELAERMDSLLKDHAELKSAVSQILHENSKTQPKASPVKP